MVAARHLLAHRHGILAPGLADQVVLAAELVALVAAGEYKHVEGKRILEPIKGKLADTLREMQEDVQSSISYAGGTQLTDLKKVNYVILGGENAGEHLFM